MNITVPYSLQEFEVEEAKGRLRLLVNRSISNVPVPFDTKSLITFCLKQIKSDKIFSVNNGQPICRVDELADIAREELEWFILVHKKTVFVENKGGLVKVFYPYPVSSSVVIEMSMQEVRKNYRRLRLNGKIFKDLNLIAIFT